MFFDFASGSLLIPGPEAEITKCLSRRGRFSGSPENLILGWMGQKVKNGGVGFWGQKVPIICNITGWGGGG